MPEIPAAPKMPNLATDYTTKLEAAKGDQVALEALRGEIKSRVSEGLISREEYSTLGNVYTRVKAWRGKAGLG
jgi:hypothetical protein